jgi:hypothetical protein
VAHLTAVFRSTHESVFSAYSACQAARAAWRLELDTLCKQLGLKSVINVATLSPKRGQGPRLAGLIVGVPSGTMPAGFCFQDGSNEIIVPSPEPPDGVEPDPRELASTLAEVKAERAKFPNEESTGTPLEEARWRISAGNDGVWEEAATVADAAFSRLEIVPDMPVAISWTGMPVEVEHGDKISRPGFARFESAIWVAWGEVDPVRALDAFESKGLWYNDAPLRYGPAINMDVWERVLLSEYHLLVEGGRDPFRGMG